jgi:hypothetical protein
VGVSAAIACRDGANWRGIGGWGYEVIYWGNDGADCSTMLNPAPDSIYATPEGFVGTVIATVNGKNMLFINEGNANAITAIEHKP